MHKTGDFILVWLYYCYQTRYQTLVVVTTSCWLLHIYHDVVCLFHNNIACKRRWLLCHSPSLGVEPVLSWCRLAYFGHAPLSLMWSEWTLCDQQWTNVPPECILNLHQVIINIWLQCMFLQRHLKLNPIAKGTDVLKIRLMWIWMPSICWGYCLL